MLDPKRILCVTKSRYIGDTVLAVPAMRALREAFPNAEMDLLTGPAAAATMAECPWFSRILVEKPGAERSPVAVLRRARELRTRNYDLSVLFNRSVRSAFLAWLAGIPTRVGFSVEMRGPLLTHRVPYDRSQHEIECMMDIVEAAGARSDDLRLELWVSPEERGICHMHGLSPKAYVCFACGANEPHLRLWPSEYFSRVGEEIARWGFRIVLLGSEGERAATRPVVQALGNAALDLSGRTTIREALGWVSEAALYVSAETGLSHCAVALGTPSVVVHGPTKWQRWGHQTETAVALWTDLGSPNPTPQEIQACLRAVHPQRVIEAARTLIKEPSFAPRP
ncbi:MAG: glycosyltransferase family 9 protein [Fimbriimonadia bacterium]